jgi:hypothetical protein
MMNWTDNGGEKKNDKCPLARLRVAAVVLQFRINRGFVAGSDNDSLCTTLVQI